MKWINILLVTLITIHSTTIVYAKETNFTDPCSQVQPSQYISYLKFVPPSKPSVLGSDKDWFALQEKGGTGSFARYRLVGAKTIQVSVYAAYGSFASFQNNAWQLGGNGGGGQTMRPKYDVEQDVVFLNATGESQTMRYEENGSFAFVPTAFKPSSSVIHFGVNVFASTDGGATGSYLPLTLINVARMTPDSPYYETYQAQIPAESNYIAVQMVDFKKYTDFEGGQSINRQTNSLCLAEVSFQGEELAWGEKPVTPEPPPSLPEPEPPPVVPPKEPEEKPSTPKPKPDKPAKEPPASSATKPPKTQTPKPSSGSTTKPPPTIKESSPKPQKDSELVSEEVVPLQETKIEQPAVVPIQEPPQKDSYKGTLGITAGIYAGGAALVASVLLWRSRKK